MPLNVQQNGSPVARRVVFALLLVASLALATAYGREGAEGPLHAAQSAVTGVAGQAAGATAGVGAAADAASDALDDVTADASTLTALREQNAELREMLAAAEEYRQEVDRLRDLLDMKQVSGATGIVGHITGRSANAWDQSVTIDVGSLDGVQAGMTILGPTGVIGQVAQTSPRTSTVRLLTDPNSGAAVMVQSSRANAIVRGSLNGLLYLEEVEEGKLPEVGDVIVTSGLGGSYERGLIVGSVANVSEESANSSASIIVSPNASAAMLEEILVVFSAPQSDVVSTVASAVGAQADAQSATASAQDAGGQYGDDGSYYGDTADGDGQYYDTSVYDASAYGEDAGY